MSKSASPGHALGIQECYKRMGKLDKALATLTEIENPVPHRRRPRRVA